MDRDRTLPAWPDLLQLPLEYFLDTLLSSRRGEGIFACEEICKALRENTSKPPFWKKI